MITRIVHCLNASLFAQRKKLFTEIRNLDSNYSAAHAFGTRKRNTC